MEIWKDIKNYEGLYQVSDLGRVRSLDHVTKTSVKKGRILKSNNISRNGYYRIYLSKDGVTKTINIHRLVAQTFIPNEENLLEVNHKNGIKTDNRASNLEWCTSSENGLTGLQDANHLKKKVRCRQLNMTFDSSYEAAEYLNKTYFNNSKQVKNVAGKIRSAVNGFQTAAYGFTWERIK